MLAEPMTRVAVGEITAPFTVLVMYGDEPRFLELVDARHIPPLPHGATYLLPQDKREIIDRYLRDDDDTRYKGAGSSWVLSITQVASDRQRIELYRGSDGFFGGVYEATSNTVQPLYRKITGPGFAFAFGGRALVLNTALWGIFFKSLQLFRRWQRASTSPS